MKTLVLSNIRFPEPHIESTLSTIIKKEEPETIVLDGDTTQCYWDYECPRVIDVLYVIRSIAPWAQVVYVQGDMDPHAVKCITAEPRYREEIIGTTMYITEAASVKYYILHGHQGDLDQLRRSIGAGPWDWVVLGQPKRLEIDKLARVIYVGGITREYPPDSRGYLVLTDSSHYIRSLKA
ncbi:phosphoesterase [Sulfuracidifex metallicus]|uniref:Phosphoesterase n=1 Tax=Sulfuracidifex metallicus DSM 6482 = JCM 9184 TaxID=523847 RepID=A0A6A9QMA0_SULME|nr:phosphoesterase [Sulfuracidifex metallicus]MCY0850339.1 phosphoesterase [Sulfuracidifex metallicus]MUN29279.1 phosphoesterase [Sulfuracidifex metallicus DSM 6482 = JCM 9184]WOE50205.1 phosphoesterase [Sulfuracidifex metallicus DSM 6482 = JCM 9184]